MSKQLMSWIKKVIYISPVKNIFPRRRRRWLLKKLPANFLVEDTVTEICFNAQLYAFMVIYYWCIYVCIFSTIHKIGILERHILNLLLFLCSGAVFTIEFWWWIDRWRWWWQCWHGWRRTNEWNAGRWWWWWWRLFNRRWWWKVS